MHKSSMLKRLDRQLNCHRLFAWPAVICLFLSVGISPAALSARAAAAGPAKATIPYGVVEIGGKGVKGYVFDMDKAANDPACFTDNDTYLKCINPTITSQINCNPISDAPLFNDTVRAVGDLMTDLKTKYGIPSKRIYVVGSSSLQTEFKRDLLVTQINQKLTVDNAVDFVTVEEEVSYGFKGVLGMLPVKWRAIRTPEATTIDIGSGNTKGAYQSTDAGGRMTFFGLDFGTKLASDAIAIIQQADNSSFRKAADKWRTTVFVPRLRAELENKTGIGSRNRVYMIGGIVWALENHMHPEDTSRFPRIQPESIDTLLDRASEPDAQGKLCSDGIKSKYPDVRKVCDTFTPNQLVGGLEIFKAISDELGFVKNKKNVFFFRDSLYAWPLGYIGNKLSIPSQR